MSLATRCTACGTIFRVVQDQLRISEGWVRCGRCAEVFDAREQLFDIDREAPPPWPNEVPVQHEETYGHDHPAELALPPDPQTWRQAGDVFADAAPPPPAPLPEPLSVIQQRVATGAEPSVAAAEESRFPPQPDSQFDSHLNSRLEPQWVDEDDAVPVASAPPTQSASAPATPLSMDAGPDVVLAPHLAERQSSQDARAEPSFMRRANHVDRWQRPGVRVALGGASALLLALLGVQITLHFHDAIVALYPPARASVQAVCQASGCELRPWQRIDAVSVENSALSQAGMGNQYQLAVSLHNKSGLEVATPWIELNLTDAAGAVIIRRMLAPTDFKTGKQSLAAGADLPLQLVLTTGQQRVNGYSVEIFHP